MALLCQAMCSRVQELTTSPRTPNLESKRESYDIGKFTTKKRQSENKQCMPQHHCSHATALKQGRNYIQHWYATTSLFT